MTLGGPPGVDFLGKVRVGNSEKWGKSENLRNKLFILPQFLGLWPHFRVPQGSIRILHFPKMPKFSKIRILQHFIKGGFQNVIFFENERACMCVWIGQKFAITYPYTWFHILWWIFLIFRDFLFFRKMSFLKIVNIFGKGSPRARRVDLFGYLRFSKYKE